MFDVTSETRDNTPVIILKPRLTLLVILSAHASLVTPSLIDDSARPLYYTKWLYYWSIDVLKNHFNLLEDEILYNIKLFVLRIVT